MSEAEKDCRLGLLSKLLRLSIAVLFLAIAYHETRHGRQVLLAKLYAVFPLIVPDLVLKLAAATLKPALLVLAFWLISGFKLKWAWFFAALFLLSFFGMLLMARQITYANQMFIYFLASGAGLVICKHDRLQF